jgi:hypothetical protein
MNRRNITCALAAAAILSLPLTAEAQSPNAAPQAQKAPEKPKADKPVPAAKADPTAKTDKPDPAANKTPDPAQDREARMKAQRESQRAQLKTLLREAPTEAVRQELRRHAERVARLERIRAVAIQQKDNDVVERVTKLLDKETARHQKWLTMHATPTKGGAQ